MRIDDKGRLVTRDGLRYLDANNQEISLQGENGTPSDVSISPRGTVSDPLDGRIFGTLGVWKLGDLNALQSVGAGRYLDGKQQKAQPAPGAPVQQGAIEGSNVDSLQEMVRMITVQRSFTAAQKALSSASRMQDSLANEILR
jgi:flagellar basal body rod protein FlgG